MTWKCNKMFIFNFSLFTAENNQRETRKATQLDRSRKTIVIVTDPDASLYIGEQGERYYDNKA